MLPVKDTLRGLKQCLFGRPPGIPGVEPMLEDTLRQAIRFGHRLEGPRSFSTESHPPLPDPRRQLDLDPFVDTMDINPRPALFARSLADGSSPFAAVLDTSMYKMPHDEAIEKVKETFAGSVPDITLFWHGGDAGSATMGGIPFLALEFKDPHRVTPAIMVETLCQFHRHTTNDREKQNFKDAQVIPVRITINKGHVVGPYRDFFLGFSQTFHHAFYNR